MTSKYQYQHTYLLKYRSHMGHEFETELTTGVVLVTDLWKLAVATALEEIHFHEEADDLASLEIRWTTSG